MSAFGKSDAVAPDNTTNTLKTRKFNLSLADNTSWENDMRELVSLFQMGSSTRRNFAFSFPRCNLIVIFYSKTPSKQLIWIVF